MNYQLAVREDVAVERCCQTISIKSASLQFDACLVKFRQTLGVSYTCLTPRFSFKTREIAYCVKCIAQQKRDVIHVILGF